MTLGTILLIVAAILFYCAAFGVPSSRVALGWLGAALYVTAQLIGAGVVR